MDQGNGGKVDVRYLLVCCLLGAVLVGGGILLAERAHTVGGEVEITETTFQTDSGVEMHASVYEPADVDEPAPTVVLIHGYTASENSMASFALEFARRGYVAVTVDQPGHGDSAPPAFADGWGGLAALEGTRSLDSVDEDRVGLVGYSMGGFAALSAAESHPDGYRSVVLLGSTTGPVESVDEDASSDTGLDGLPDGDAEFPRNLAVIFGRYDELAVLLWGEDGHDLENSQKLADLFDTNPPVEANRQYGAWEDGTARQFVGPAVSHTRMHRSETTIAETVRWSATALDGPTDPQPDDQLWRQATIGDNLTFLGALLVVFPILLLARREFADSPSTVESTPLHRGKAVTLAAAPAIAFYPAYILNLLVPATRVTPQGTTNGTLLWACLTALLVAAVFRWRYGLDRSAIRRIRPTRATFLQALFVAVTTVGALYALVAAIDALTVANVALWSLDPRTLTPLRWIAFGLYVVPFTLVTLGLAAALHRGIGPTSSPSQDVVRSVLVVTAGAAVVLAAQYGPLFLGYGLPVPEIGLFTIALVYNTVLLGFLATVSTVVYRTTGNLWAAALTTGLLATWLVVGIEPFHVIPI